MKTWLTVDLGNTRCKFQLWSFDPSGLPVAHEEAALDTPAIFDLDPAADDSMRLAEPVGAWLESSAPQRVFLTSVASAEVTGRVERALQALHPSPSGTGAEAAHDLQPGPDLENRCRVPEEVGRDRLMAAFGASELLGRSAIVVDAGTALTVDAVLVPASGGPAAFLGGAIAPGPELLADALRQRAARLPEVKLIPGSPALGRDTSDAIRSGCGTGFRGTARELVSAISRSTDLEDAPVVLTGGARAFLLEPEPFLERDLRVEPRLVHLGLLAAAGVAIRGERR